MTSVPKSPSFVPRSSFLILATLVAPACSVNVGDFPTGSQVSCDTSADCPGSTTCVRGRCVGSDVTDLDPPLLISATLDDPDALYGLAPGGGAASVVLTLEVDEPLFDLSSVRMTGGEFGADFGPPVATSGVAEPTTYRLTYEPDLTEPQGTLLVLTATLVDLLGNRGDVLLPVQVQFDFDPPEVVTTLGREPTKLLQPDPTNLRFSDILNDPVNSPIARSTDVLVSFETSEIVSNVVVSTVQSSPIAFQQFSQAGVAFLYQLDWDASESAAMGATLDGTYDLQVTFEDQAGNAIDPGNTALGVQLVIDTTPPSPPTVTGRNIVLVRAPWGDAQNPGQSSFTVEGPAGSVDADTVIAAYQAAEGVGLFGQAQANSSGAFGAPAGTPFSLATNGVDFLYVQSLDDAGNPSDADPGTAGAQRSLVSEVVTLNTMGRKVVGDISANPHDLSLRPTFRNILEPDLDQQLLGAVDGVDAPSEGTTVVASGGGRWQLMGQEFGVPAGAVDFALGANPVTGEVVIFGGMDPVTESGPSGDEIVCRQSGLGVHDRAYRRSRWTLPWRPETILNDGPGAERGAAFVYFGKGERMVLVDGSDNGKVALWTLFNQSWVKLCGDPACGASAPAARVDFSAAYDPLRGVLVLFDGETWEWDGIVWRQVCSASPCSDNTPGARPDQGFTFDENLEEVLLFGGAAGDETWSWNGTSWTQHCTGGCTRPSPRNRTAMVFDRASGQTVLFGGAEADQVCNPFTPEMFQTDTFADTWVFEAGAWTQRAPATSPGSRYGHRMVYDELSGSVLLVGGTDCGCEGGDPRPTQTWRWDGSDWRRINVNLSGVDLEVPPPTAGASFSYMPALGENVLYHSSAQPSGSASGSDGVPSWRWNGSAWDYWDFPPIVMETPGKRRGAGFAAANNASNPVLLGGTGAGSTGDPQELRSGGNRTDWQAPLTAGECGAEGCPGFRVGLAMAGNGTGLVAFGGSRIEGPPCGEPAEIWLCYMRNDTWYHDGAEWAEAMGAGPSPRMYGSMSATSTGGEVMLFGGMNPSRTALSDTWVFDANSETWTALSPAQSPGARGSAGFAFDPRRQAPTLFGGSNVLYQFVPSGPTPSHDIPYPDVWEWTGTDWATMPVLDPELDGAPSARFGPAFAYDPANRAMVMFGGISSGLLLGEPVIPDNISFATPNNDTWLWYSQSRHRPGVVFTVEGAGIAVNDLVVEGLRIEFYGSASSASAGVPTNDVEFLLWLGDRWWPLQGTQQGSPTVWDSSADPVFASNPGRLNAALTLDRQVRIAAVPSGTNEAPGYASFEVDYISAELRYTVSP